MDKIRTEWKVTSEIGLRIRSLRFEDRPMPRDWMGALHLLHGRLQGRDAWRHKDCHTINCVSLGLYALYFNKGGDTNEGCGKGK